VTRPAKGNNLFSKQYYFDKTFMLYESSMGIKKDFRSALFIFLANNKKINPLIRLTWMKG